MTRFFATIAAIALCLTPAWAEEATNSAHEASLARTSWDAFVCHSFAKQARLPHPELERLMQIGTSAVKNYISAFQAGRISENDINAFVPLGFVYATEGPNPDFILGRVFESANREAFDDVTEVPAYGLFGEAPITAENLTPEDRVHFARILYRHNQCSVISFTPPSE